MMMKVDRFRPEDPERQDAWHKARLDLQGFMRQNGHNLSIETVQNAREMYGPTDQAKHPYPSWSKHRGWYVKLIYAFILDCIREMEQNKTELRKAA